jgi:beta-lactam-binding protein with PASTA domain
MNWRAISRRLMLYATVAAGGFLLAYLIVAFFIFPRGVIPDDARVPSVVGLLYDDAARRLIAAGFKPAVGLSRYNASAPQGTVLAQTPPADSREKRGINVALDVSAGDRQSQVPPVVGLTQQLATAAIENAGLKVGTIGSREADSPRGAVLESLPGPGQSVAPGTRVDLVVSSGPPEIAVPDLVGRDYTQARLMLEQLGLRPGAVTIDSTAVDAPNTVVSQSPAAGASLRPGGTVSLRVTPQIP